MRTFPQLLATILINEIEPLCKKHGRRPPVDFSVALTVMEHEGKHTRHQTRALLKEYYAVSS
jgi:hypothetical protein